MKDNLQQILFPIHSLSNIDIEQYFKHFNIEGKVVPRDKVGKKIKGNSCIVINLDDSSGPGTHWIVLVNSSKSKNLLYYDPFGLEYPPEEVLHMNIKKGLVANTSQHQNIDSILCGYYCLKVAKSILVDKMNYRDCMLQFTDSPSHHNQDIADNLL